jgi:hypothetical protein
MQMAASMKECGKKTFDMEKVSNAIQMVTRIMATLKWERLTAREFTPGPMEKYTTENGFRDLNKAMEFGVDFITTAISENGKSQRPTGMEFILGKMETVMKANGTCVSSTVQERTFSQIVTLIQENTRMANPMEKANTSGKTEPLM